MSSAGVQTKIENTFLKVFLNAFHSLGIGKGCYTSMRWIKSKERLSQSRW